MALELTARGWQAGWIIIWKVSNYEFHCDPLKFVTHAEEKATVGRSMADFRWPADNSIEWDDDDDNDVCDVGRSSDHENRGRCRVVDNTSRTTPVR